MAKLLDEGAFSGKYIEASPKLFFIPSPQAEKGTRGEVFIYFYCDGYDFSLLAAVITHPSLRVSPLFQERGLRGELVL
jgi:hypothetical protein